MSYLCPKSVFWVVSLGKMEAFSVFLFAILAANFEFSACRKQKYTAYNRYMDTFRMVKFQRNNQSERSDLPQDCLVI